MRSVLAKCNVLLHNDGYYTSLLSNRIRKRSHELSEPITKINEDAAYKPVMTADLIKWLLNSNGQWQNNDNLAACNPNTCRVL